MASSLQQRRFLALALFFSLVLCLYQVFIVYTNWLAPWLAATLVSSNDGRGSALRPGESLTPMKEMLRGQRPRLRMEPADLSVADANYHPPPDPAELAKRPVVKVNAIVDGVRDPRGAGAMRSADGPPRIVEWPSGQSRGEQAAPPAPPPLVGPQVRPRPSERTMRSEEQYNNAPTHDDPRRQRHDGGSGAAPQQSPHQHPSPPCNIWAKMNNGEAMKTPYPNAAFSTMLVVTPVTQAMLECEQLNFRLKELVTNNEALAQQEKVPGLTELAERLMCPGVSCTYVEPGALSSNPDGELLLEERDDGGVDHSGQGRSVGTGSSVLELTGITAETVRQAVASVQKKRAGAASSGAGTRESSFRPPPVGAVVQAIAMNMQRRNAGRLPAVVHHGRKLSSSVNLQHSSPSVLHRGERPTIAVAACFVMETGNRGVGNSYPNHKLRKDLVWFNYDLKKRKEIAGAHSCDPALSADGEHILLNEEESSSGMDLHAIRHHDAHEERSPVQGRYTGNAPAVQHLVHGRYPNAVGAECRWSGPQIGRRFRSPDLAGEKDGAGRDAAAGDGAYNSGLFSKILAGRRILLSKSG